MYLYNSLQRFYLFLRNGARFLRKRILAAGRQNAEIDAAWRLCVIMWERRYDEFYEALAAYPWSELVLPLVESLRGWLRMMG